MTAKPHWAWIVFLIGLLASAAAALWIKQGVEQAAVRQFSFTSDETTLKIKDRLDAYALILRGGAGLFSASDAVDRAEWRGYVELLRADDSVPGVQGIGFAKRIAPDQLDAHMADIRREGFPAYVVHPPGKRPLYTPVIYLEPFRDRNLRAFGYDIYAEPTRRAAMDLARDTGQVALSGKLALIQETGRQIQAGTVMYFPVYRIGAPAATKAQRQAALVGWTFSPFRMNDLMQGILEGWTDHQGQTVDLHVYDGPAAVPAALLFDSMPLCAPDDKSRFYQTRTIAFHGRQWTLAFDAVAGADVIDYSKAWAALIGGLTISGLLSGLLLSLITTKAQAHRIAGTLTEEVRRREQALLASETRFRNMFELNDSVMLLIESGSGRITDANPAAARFYGYPVDQLKAMRIDQINTLAPAEVAQRRAEAAEHKRNYFTFPHRLANGDIRTVEVRSSPIGRNSDVLLFSIVHDVTERLYLEEQIKNLAFFDPLTQLANRRLLGDRLNQVMAANKRSGCFGALLFVDLDNFKPLNDQHGHVAGDLLLVEVARRLKSCVREMDTVARFGGDEFVVMAAELDRDETTSLAQLRVIADKILRALAAPYRLSLHRDDGSTTTVEHQCTASIGGTLFQGHEPSKESIFRAADAAMYQAKDAGRNAVRLTGGTGITNMHH